MKKKSTNILDFVIFGASFDNTGAQSMIFVMVSQLRRYYPNCRIHVMATSANDNRLIKALSFDYVLYKPDYDSRFRFSFWGKVNSFFREKYTILRKPNFISYRQYCNIIKHCAVVFDISGYMLSSQWPLYDCERYLNRIDLSKKYGKKVAIMPQSFGPFEFDKECYSSIVNHIKSTLGKTDLLFVREHEGVRELKKIGVNNLHYATDIVLQNKTCECDLLFKQKIVVNDYLSDFDEGIAVIPNYHSISANSQELLLQYKSAIEFLRNKGEKIYIIRHSKPDKEACILVKKMFENDNDVVLVDNCYNSLEFEKITKHLKFSIASRYHSIVHCYRNAVPCVVVGWATKYQELLELFCQNKYLYDVRKIEYLQDLTNLTCSMYTEYLNEKNKIVDMLRDIQKSSSFEIIREMIGE